MDKFSWTDKDEIKWKNNIEVFFAKVFESDLYVRSPLEFGDSLFKIFKESEIEAVRLVAPRAIRKWASTETAEKWQKIIDDDKMLLELRNIGKSIANTLRPLAGNKFAMYVAKILNATFDKEQLRLTCQTSGKEKIYQKN